MIEQLKNKYILVDTCVIKYLFYQSEHSAIVKFINNFLKLECALCINEVINIEFLRIAKNKQQKEKIEFFLNEYFFNLPVTHDTFESVKNIYPLYNFCSSVRNHNQISIVDAINICLLQKYQKNLFFITLDHSDYPIELVDRDIIGAIDLSKAIITWGIYKFSGNKFNKLLNLYNRDN